MQPEAPPDEPTIWKRFSKFYTTLSVIVFNTLLVLVLVEGGATLINILHPPPTSLAETSLQYQTRMANRPYYRDQDWAADYWAEHVKVVDRWAYHPYTIWRTLPFDGKHIHVDENGIRVTPGSECGEDTYRIFAFGGSTMWGFGVPDWGTISAYLQKNMEDRDVCVIVQGDLAYNSTQSTIRLMQLLQKGDRPDLVIFYDGVNEVAPASRTGEAGTHFFIENISPVVKGTLIERKPVTDILRELITRTSVYRMLYGDFSTPEPNWATEPFDPEFVQDIVNIYLTNLRTVELWAEEYDFEFVAFVQPVLALKEDELNEEEQVIMWNTPQVMVDLFRVVYPYLEEAAAQKDDLVYLGDVLFGQDYPIWVDYCHVTPWGNLIVAHEITQVILPTIDAALSAR